MRHKMLFLLWVFALALLAGCGTTSGHYVPPSPFPAIAPPAALATPSPSHSPAPTPTPTPEPSPTPDPAAPYQFGTPLEESEGVEDDSFFDSSVFLGDSRTEGLELFSGLKHGDFYWARGMTVFKADSEDYRPFEIDGKKYSMVEALALKQYDNVYIMLGVNERSEERRVGKEC